MAVTLIMQLDGASAQDYDRVNDELGIHGPGDEPAGLIAHVCAVGDEGLLVVDTWESPEHAERFSERLVAVLAKLDLESSSQPLVLQTHNYMLAPAYVAH